MLASNRALDWIIESSWLISPEARLFVTQSQIVRFRYCGWLYLILLQLAGQVCMEFVFWSGNYPIPIIAESIMVRRATRIDARRIRQ